PKIAALLFFMFFPLAAHAQTPAPAPEDASVEASIEELVQILQNDDTRALLIERLQQTAGEGEAGALEAETDLSLVRQLSQYTQKAARSTAETFDSLGRIFRDIGRGLSTT